LCPLILKNKFLLKNGYDTVNLLSPYLIVNLIQPYIVKNIPFSSAELFFLPFKYIFIIIERIIIWL